MIIGCNIWMICLKLNGFFYGLSRMLQFSQFVWTPCYSVWDVFNNFLLIDATDRSKMRGDQKRFFIALSLYPLSFSWTLPLKAESELQYKRIVFFSVTVLQYSFLRNYDILSKFLHFKRSDSQWYPILSSNFVNSPFIEEITQMMKNY